MSFFKIALCVSLVVLLWMSLVIAQEQDPDALYFVQITDPHFGCGPSVESTIDVIEAIQQMPLRFEFVALTGDVLCDNVDEDIAQQGFDALKQLTVPVYVLAGNHDYVGTNVITYSQHVADLNYAVEHSGTLLLFVSSVNPTHNPEKKLIAWIQDKLSAHPGMSALLFHHEPFMLGEYSPYTLASLKPWKALLADSVVVAAFAGHLHRDALLWHGDIPEFVASCILPWDGRQSSFRLYEYNDGRVSYQTFYVSEN